MRKMEILAETEDGQEVVAVMIQQEIWNYPGYYDLPEFFYNGERMNCRDKQHLVNLENTFKLKILSFINWDNLLR